VTEETRPTGPTSRRCPARVRGRCPYIFRGFHRPLLRGVACRPYGSGQHNVTELTLAFPHSSYSARDGLTGRVGGTTPGFDSQAVSTSAGGMDPGARGVSEHLMLWSGECVRGLRTRVTPERGGDSLEGGGA
jgi:hypothetical protein